MLEKIKNWKYFILIASFITIILIRFKSFFINFLSKKAQKDLEKVEKKHESLNAKLDQYDKNNKDQLELARDLQNKIDSLKADDKYWYKKIKRDDK